MQTQAAKSISEIFASNLRENKIIYYEDINLLHQNFDELNFDDIKQYFLVGGKESCIPEELSDFFSNSDMGKSRTQHMFSVYLLGIYCYDNIKYIRDSFHDFIKRIYDKTSETNSPDANLRKDFLYLWFLTALFHDMGYHYEKKGDNDNSDYHFIITRKNMLNKDNLGSKPVLGIPKDIQFAAADYFEHRRNNVLFNEHLCTDHGFAGGYLLFKTLQKLHNEKKSYEQTIKSPIQNDKLLFDPLIFEWYNKPSAWAIICHNIWLAEAGTGNAVKYEKLGMQKLIFQPGYSPIKCEKHPLLFLLCFVDTIEPLKLKDNNILNSTLLSVNKNSELTLIFNSCNETICSVCPFTEKYAKKLCTNLDFLKSTTFTTIPNQNSIKFIFGKSAENAE